MNSTAFWRFWSLRAIILVIKIFRDIKFLEFLLGNCKSKIFDTFKDTIISFSTYFSEFVAMLLNDIFSFLWLNKNYLRTDFTITITFISKKKNFNIFITVILSFWNPKVFNIFKRWRLSKIVYHDDTISSFIVSWCDGSESLLSGSVPDLELDGFSLILNGFESLFKWELPEVNTDCSEIIFWEFILCELH